MRIRIAILAFSIALHGIAFWAIWRLPPAPAGGIERRQTLELAFLAPSPSLVVPKPPEPPPQRRRPRLTTHRSAQPKRVEQGATETAPAATLLREETPPAVEGPPQPAAGAEQQKLDLFAGVPVAAQPASEPNTAVARAEQGFHTWRRELRGAEAARVVPRGVKQFGERLSRYFSADADSLQRNSALGIGTLGTLPNYFKKATGQGSIVDQKTQQMGPSLIQDPRSSASGSVAYVCFGACNGFSHDVSTMRAVVTVQHRRDGTAETWRLSESSGDVPFDEAALAGVRDTAAMMGHWPDGVPTESRWEFVAQALRWSRAELLLDPLFTPPGRTVRSDILGITTMVEAVRLLWLELREE